MHASLPVWYLGNIPLVKLAIAVGHDEFRFSPQQRKSKSEARSENYTVRDRHPPELTGGAMPLTASCPLSMEFYAHRKCRKLFSGSRGDSVLCNRAKLLHLRLHRRHLRLCEFGLQRENLAHVLGTDELLRQVEGCVDVVFCK